jgi:hypothetical protein
MNNYPGGGMDDQNQQMASTPQPQDYNPYNQPVPSESSNTGNNDAPSNAVSFVPGSDTTSPVQTSPNPYSNMPDEPKDDTTPQDNTTNDDSEEIKSPLYDDDLLNIKQEALQALSPLVSKLEQSPEEKFKTTMMMIQASDDQSLISTAYETAKEITDDKARAQALLDVVNEINYFTQQK